MTGDTPADVLVDERDRQQARRCFERPVVVEAAAGTGKTTLLVDRIVHALFDPSHPARLSEIAAITFTEKAAAEMKERLRDRLERMLRNGSDKHLGNVHRSVVEAALRDLDVAQISTIHSFCMTILRERPVEAGLDPETTVADEVQQELLFQEAWRRWLERELAEETEAERTALGRALLHGVPLSGTYRRQHSLYQTARRMVEHRDFWAPLNAPKPLWQWYNTWVRPHQQKLRRFLADNVGNKQTKLLLFIRDFLALDPEATADSEPAIRERLIALSSCEKLGSTVHWVGGRPQGEEIAEYCNRLRFECAALAHADLLRDLTQKLHGVVELYERLKKQRNLVDFLDLLIRVRDLFERHPDVRAYFGRRFKHVLIDEFQDTDPIQMDIAVMLIEAFGDGGDGPSLFVVGDPKQSIYRFRRADIETYQKAVEHFEARGGVKLFLKSNFRSVPSILQFVNAVFEQKIRRPKDGSYQPDYVPLEPAPGAADHEHSGVYLLLAPSNVRAAGAKVGARWLRRYEGYALGQFIQHAVQEGWPVGSANPRPLRYGDVAILLERTTDLEEYELGLQAAGVPFRVMGAKRFYQRLELKTVLNILKAVDQPAVPLRVVAAVRTPVFGISDEDLARHCLRGLPLNYLKCTAEDTPLAPAFDVLRKLYALRNRVPVHQTVDRLLEATAALEFFASLPNGLERANSLLHLREEAQRLSAAGVNFKAFLAWLEERASATEEETELPEPETDEGAVRILTMHASKGLEFPMVLLAGICAGKQAEVTAPLLSAGHNGKPRIEMRIGKDLFTAGWRAAEEQEKKRLEAERIRLFYVACTRAKDYLVLPVGWRYRAPGQAMAQFLPEALWNPEELEGKTEVCYGDVRIRVVDSTSWGLPRAVPRHPRIEPKRLSGDSVARQAARIKAAVRGAETKWQAATEQAHRGLLIVHPSELTEHDPERPARAQARSRAGAVQGQAVGSLVHRILQVAVEEQVNELTELADRLEGWARAFGVDESSAQEALKLAENMWRNQEFRQLLNGGEAFTEVPIVAPLSHGSQEGLVEGVIDLLVQRPDGSIVIVDYKTDALTRNWRRDLLRTYGPQIRCYGDAIQSALKPPSVELYLAVVVNGSLLQVADPRGARRRS